MSQDLQTAVTSVLFPPPPTRTLPVVKAQALRGPSSSFGVITHKWRRIIHGKF